MKKYFDYIKGIYLHPNKTFQKIVEDDKIPLIYVILAIILVNLLEYIFVLPHEFRSLLRTIVGSFVIMLIIHGILRLFTKKGSLPKLIITLGFAFFATSILSLGILIFKTVLPYYSTIIFLFTIYGLCLQIAAVKAVYSISLHSVKRKAIFIIIFSAILLGYPLISNLIFNLDTIYKWGPVLKSRITNYIGRTANIGWKTYDQGLYSLKYPNSLNIYKFSQNQFGSDIIIDVGNQHRADPITQRIIDPNNNFSLLSINLNSLPEKNYTVSNYKVAVINDNVDDLVRYWWWRLYYTAKNSSSDMSPTNIVVEKIGNKLGRSFIYNGTKSIYVQLGADKYASISLKDLSSNQQQYKDIIQQIIDGIQFK